MLGEPPRDPYDLEAALAQLDVDLDELSVSADPAAPRGRGARAQHPPSASRPEPRRPRRAATEDDGVLIDFDDDDGDGA